MAGRQAMAESEWVIKAPATQPFGTIYVHLCSGEVREIDNVDEIAMTDAQVIFTRGNLEAVVLPRRDIYYSCCEAGEAPPAY
jgi:hypothetical protein